MKRIYILTLLFSFCSWMAHAQESLFDKYAEMKGVSSVFISKTMIDLMPHVVDAEDINVSRMAGKIDNIRILSCESRPVIVRLKKDLSLIDKNGYEELMRMNDEGDKTTIYLKKKDNGKNEFVLLNDEKDELSIIVITGSLALQEIQEIMED